MKGQTPPCHLEKCTCPLTRRTIPWRTWIESSLALFYAFGSESTFACANAVRFSHVRLCVGQFGKVLRPDPPDLFCRVILVLREPELAFLGNHVKDLYSIVSVLHPAEPLDGAYLAGLVYEVRIPGLMLRRCNIELKKRCCEPEHVIPIRSSRSFPRRGSG